MSKFNFVDFYFSGKEKKDQRSKKALELSVPKRTDHPIMGVQCTRNFINTNASNAIVAVPKKPLPVYVDRRQGDRFLLETSGLVPKYLKKKVGLYRVAKKKKRNGAEKYR